MGTVYLANAFSLGMLGYGYWTVKVKSADLTDVKRVLKRGFTSIVGHEATANILSRLLGVEVKAERVRVQLNDGDVVVVFQLLQRLPEGKILTEEELENIKYMFYIVKVQEEFI